MSSDNRPPLTILSYRSPWTLGESPSFDCLLEQAEDLIAIGHTRAAGCLARQAIERGLLDMCLARRAIVRHPVSGREFTPYETSTRVRLVIATLEASRAIDSTLREQIEAAITIGNSCCHGLAIGLSQVASAIEMAKVVKAHTVRVRQSTDDRLKQRIADCAARKVARLARAATAPAAVRLSESALARLAANPAEPFTIVC
jgi:hypothetical protein